MNVALIGTRAAYLHPFLSETGLNTQQVFLLSVPRRFRYCSSSVLALRKHTYLNILKIL